MDTHNRSNAEALQDLSVKMARLEERMDGFMRQTTEYRKSLCTKLDSVISKMSDLPCKERIQIYRSVGIQLKAIWAFLVAVLLAIIGDWVRR